LLFLLFFSVVLREGAQSLCISCSLGRDLMLLRAWCQHSLLVQDLASSWACTFRLILGGNDYGGQSRSRHFSCWVFCFCFCSIKIILARCRLLTPIILTIQMAELRRIKFQSQSPDKEFVRPCLKKPFTKKGWWNGSRCRP
jgi:hypothetical protein